MNKQRGYTLVELLIYLALISIFFVAFSSIFTTILQLKTKVYQSSPMDYNGQYLMQRLVYDIRQAETISTPANLGQTSDSLSLMINGENYTYTLVNHVIFLTNNNGSFPISDNLTNVQSISFQRIGNVDGLVSIKFNLNLESITPEEGKKQIKNFTSTVAIR